MGVSKRTTLLVRITSNRVGSGTVDSRSYSVNQWRDLGMHSFLIDTLATEILAIAPKHKNNLNVNRLVLE